MRKAVAERVGLAFQASRRGICGQIFEINFGSGISDRQKTI
jgi:hypothetical protein